MVMIYANNLNIKQKVGFFMPETAYERYLSADKILSFQKKDEDLICDGERDFQGVQQEGEFIWTRINLMLKRTSEKLQAGNIWEAVNLLQQAANLWTGLTQKSEELLMRLWPNDFLKVRKIIGEGASTADSPRYHESERLARSLWPHFERILEKSSLKLPELLREEPDDKGHRDIQSLLKAMMWYDYRVQEFAISHIYLVFGIIGDRTVGLKGGTSEFLINRYKSYLFPQLWESINSLYVDFKPKQ